MPIDPDFLQMLVCPETRVPLRCAGSAELDRVNELIRSGRARNRGGDAVGETLEEGLVPDGEAVVYPIRDEIPILLRHEAILLDDQAAPRSTVEGKV